MVFTIHSSDHLGDATRHDYPHTAKINSVEDLIEATRNDHTVGNFGGENRGKKNFQGADCLLADIDNAERIKEYWVDLDIIKETFQEYTFAVTPSRNHMKTKGKESARPKFHLYFPIPFTPSAEKLERLLRLLHTRFEEIGFDPNVKDAARFFYGHGGKQQPEAFWIQNGKPISSALGGRPKGTGKRKMVPWRDLTLEELAKNPEIVPIGERYEIHKRIAMYWANTGLDADQIEAALIDYNRRMPEPREMFHEKVKVQTRALADSAAKKVEKEGGPNPSLAYNRIRNYHNVKTEDGLVKVPVQVTSEEMFAAMKEFVSLQDKAGGRILTLRKDPRHIVSKASDLRDALESVGYVWDVRNIAGSMGKEDILVAFRNRSEGISRMTCVPEHDMEKGTLFVPQIEFPEPGENGTFREFLDIFTFKTKQDQYRFAAGLLSTYLSAYYDGKIPMFALLAEAQNAGKTTVVREAVRLITGMSALEQKGGKYDQADDHAQFAGVLGLASRAVIYDNLVKLNKEEEVGITRAITDDYRSAWMMGVSRTHIRNSYIYFATFNDSEGFGKDLQARIVAVRMMDPKDVDRDRRDEITVALSSWRLRQQEVIADVRYLIGLQEKPARDSYIPTMKNGDWALRIVPALQKVFPEVDCFDFSSDREDHRIDPMIGFLNDTLRSVIKALDDQSIFPKIGGGYQIEFGPNHLFEAFAAVSPKYIERMSPREFVRTLKEYRHDLGGIEMEVGQRYKGPDRGRMLYTFTIPENVHDSIRKPGKKGPISVEY